MLIGSLVPMVYEEAVESVQKGLDIHEKLPVISLCHVDLLAVSSIVPNGVRIPIWALILLFIPRVPHDYEGNFSPISQGQVSCSEDGIGMLCSNSY